MTDDIVVYDEVHRGFLRRGKDAQIDFVSRYHKNFRTTGFSNFVRMIANYFRMDKLSRMAVFRNFGTDSMLLANYMLNDAEMVGTLLRDVANGYRYDQPLLRPKRSVDEPTQEPTAEIGSGNILINLSLMSIGEYATEERIIGLEVTKEPPLGSTLSDVSPTTEFSTSMDSKQAGSASVIDGKIPNSQSQNGEIPAQRIRVKRSDLNVSEEKINQRTSQSSSVEQNGTLSKVSQPVSANPTIYNKFSALINRGVGKSEAQNRTSTRRQNKNKLVGMNL